MTQPCCVCLYRAHLDSLLKYVEDGQKEGANLVYGGKRVDRPGESCPLWCCDPVVFVSSGYFMEPAVFTGAEDHMFIAREESFGPVMVISVFENG